MKFLSDSIIRSKHEKFIETAHHFNDNNLEKQLFNHFEVKHDEEAVVHHKDKSLISDIDIISHSMLYFNELMENLKPLNLITNDKKCVDALIGKSCSDDINYKNRLFTSQELNDAIKHFPNNKSVGLDGKRM